MKKNSLILLFVVLFLSAQAKAPKYVFYFIGDGMSVPQVTLADEMLRHEAYKTSYEAQTKTKILGDTLCMRSFPVVGLCNTAATNRYITGSAAAATALSTGHKTSINTLGMNAERTEELYAVAEMARDKGMKIGVLSSVSIDHATPAGFYAKAESRNNYERIGKQLVATNFDYFAGGFVRYFNYSSDDKTSTSFKEMAKKNGYSFSFGKEDLAALSGKSTKVIASISRLDTCACWGSALPYTIDKDSIASEDDQLSLADFVEKGIEVLQDNKAGFFMMAEGGKIDWASHNNDANTMLYEMIAFDQAIAKAVEFYNLHPKETLIIVTGDHETGGLSLGNPDTNYESYYDRLSYQKISYEVLVGQINQWKKQGNITFSDALSYIQYNYGIGVDSLGLGLNEEDLAYLELAFNASVTPKSKESTVEVKMGKDSIDARLIAQRAAQARKEKKAQKVTAKVKLNKREKAIMYGAREPFMVAVHHLLAAKAGISWASFAHTALPAAVFAKGQCAEEFTGYYDNNDVPLKLMSIMKLSNKQ